METVRDMRGVLGGFRNMLRQWRINYLRNKKKKQKEIEEGKLAKYYTLKRIAYSSIALICSPFGLFHIPRKEITKEYPDLVKIQKNIISLQKKASEISTKQKEKTIQQIEQQIEVTEKKIYQTISKRSNVVQQEVIQTIQQIKKEVISLKNPIPLKTKEVSIKSTSMNNHISSHTNKTIKETNNNSIKVHFDPIKPNTLSNYSSAEKEKKPVEKTVPLLCNDKSIEKAKVKEIKEDIEALTLKIHTTEDYNLFYTYEQKLKNCKKELEEMLEGLEKSNFIHFLSDMETNERKIPIIELLEQVNKLEKEISEKKKMIYHTNTNSKTEEKNIEEKVKPKKEESKKKEAPISEWQQAQILIMQQLENQQKQIIEFEKRKSKTSQKSLFKTLSSFAMHAIGFLFSFTPITLFKNKILGTLTTTIMVNNSLKSMRKLLHPQEEINYEWLGQELKEKQSILENTYRVSEDSLYQIHVIKEDVLFLLKDNPENMEILSFLKQLETIEKETSLINQRIKREANIIDKQYTKVFTKGVE